MPRQFARELFTVMIPVLRLVHFIDGAAVNRDVTSSKLMMHDLFSCWWEKRISRVIREG